jgi:hypothetical protein
MLASGWEGSSMPHDPSPQPSPPICNNHLMMAPAFFPNARRWRAQNFILTMQEPTPFPMRQLLMMSGATAAPTGDVSASEVQAAAAASVSEAPANSPPTQASFLLYRLLPRADRNVIRGDMEEEFKARLAKDGPTCARRWFWRETAWTIVQQNPVCRSILVGGLMRLGDWIFRQIGG